MRHFHSIAVAQILHFAHSHGEKQKQDFIFHCKYLHKQLLSWQTRLPTLITDKKKIFLISAHSHSTLRLFTYNEWWFLFYVYLMQKFIEAHPVFAAKAWMEKWKLKKNTHTQSTNKEMNFWVPMSPTNFTWCNFDGKCIRVVHPADKIFVGLWYNGRKALWWNIQITEERQNFLMCKYGYLPDEVRTNCSQNAINSSKVKLVLLQRESCIK